MSDDNGSVRLETGQTVRLNQGVVQVVKTAEPEGYHFKMTVLHYTGSKLEARAGDYDTLTAFFEQLRQLDYVLLDITRMSGAAPAARIGIA